MSARRHFLLQLFGLAGITAACGDAEAPLVTPIDPGSGQQPSQPDPVQEPPAEPISPKLRFAVCSDGHYGQPGTKYVETHQNMIRWLNQEQQNNGLDYIIFNGDIVHDEPAFLPEVSQVFKALRTPYYVTRGNHDMFSDALWEHTWGYLPNHVFESELYGFVLGDTSNEKGEYIPVDPGWLKASLEKLKEKQKVFVFLHVPQTSWTAGSVKPSEAMRLLESYANVTAIFHGHQHEKDNIEKSGGKPYIFDGRFGGSWGVPYQGYRIVEIDEAGKVRTFQFDPVRDLVINQFDFA